MNTPTLQVRPLTKWERLKSRARNLARKIKGLGASRVVLVGALGAFAGNLDRVIALFKTDPPRLATFADGVTSTYAAGDDVFISFQMDILNNGSPSATRDWRLEIIRPGKKPTFGLLVTKPSGLLDFKVPGMDVEQDWLPNKPTANPIVRGGKASGYVLFKIPDVTTPGALNDIAILFRVSFRDAANKRVICDYANSRMRTMNSR